MRPLRINGRRIPCQTCRRRYAIIMWAGTTAVCASCNRAFFVGFMVGRNVGVADICETYDLVKKKEAKGRQSC